jgi:glyoxylase-like metal-dependent hydrolase (beta-lactamase superfamily II)
MLWLTFDTRKVFPHVAEPAGVDHTFDLTTQLGDAIVQLRLPMAGSPLRYVNSYLLEDDGAYTLVDCGWNCGDVLAALHEGLARCGIALKDVTRVLVTHAHYDHYGLAGTLRRSGLRELLLHRLDWAFARLLLTDPAATDRAADEWIARNGLRIDEPFDDVHGRLSELTEPTQLLEDGDRIGRLRAVWTPGHTPGHLCFLDTRSGKMLTGDHILDPITPHVGVWGERGENPLDAYVASLHKVAALGASGVLPAHGEPFADLQRRVDELLAHEAGRQAQVLAALTRGAGDATTVARAIPWTRRERPFDELAPAHQQFAVAETLAHLEAARARGLVARDADATPYAYALA